MLVKNLTNSERKGTGIFYDFNRENDKRIEGRLVYNGKPTRNFINKDDSASPAAANESINITCCIDAHESRDIMSADIPNAFVQTKLPSKDKNGKKVTMKITRVLVDMLVELNPQLFASFVMREIIEK